MTKTKPHPPIYYPHRALLVAGFCSLLSFVAIAHADTNPPFQLELALRPTSFPLTLPTDTGTAINASYFTRGATNYYQNSYPGGNNLVQVAVNSFAIFGLKTNGTVISWNAGNSTPEADIPKSLTNVVQIAAKGGTMAALRNDGSVFVSVRDARASLGLTNVPSDLTNAVQLAVNTQRGLALKSDGTVEVWGLYANYNQPPEGLTNVVQVAITANGAPLALKDDGTVTAWGDTNISAYNVPAGLTNVVQITTGDRVVFALKNDGTVVGWGSIISYENNVPAGLTNVVQIAAANNCAYALKSDGTLVGWGLDSHDHNITTLPGTTEVLQIAAGDGLCAALIPTRAFQSLKPFPKIPAKPFGSAPFTVKPPVASSGLPVTLSVLSGPATTSNNMVTLNGAGPVTLAANQPGSTNFWPADSLTASFVAGKATQSITPLGKLPDMVFGSAPFAITNATAGSGLPVSVNVKSGPAFSTNNTIYITGAGLVSITASQGGDNTYLPAKPVGGVIKVNKASQTIYTPETIPDLVYTKDAGFYFPPPSTSSGLEPVATVKSGPAKKNGIGFALTGTGTVVLAFNQLGNKNYLPAQEVTANIIVTNPK